MKKAIGIALCFCAVFTTQAQITLHDLLERVEAAHEGSYGYNVTVKSTSGSNPPTISKYDLFGNDGAVLIETNTGQHYMDEEVSIRVNQNQELIIVEQQLNNQFGDLVHGIEDQEDTNLVIELNRLNESIVLSIRQIDGSVNIVHVIHPESYRMMSTTIEDTRTEQHSKLSIDYTVVAQSQLKEISQEFVVIGQNEISPTSKFIDYEVFNILF